MPLDLLFFGAHPDDIEIGAGGTVAKLAASGRKVGICIVSDEVDPHTRDIRRREAISAAAILGVPEDRVLFLGLPDGYIAADGDTVAKLRAALSERNWANTPIAFTHTEADRHNDHGNATKLALAALRPATFLYYPVVNHLLDDHFKPRIFVDTSATREQKTRALQEHVSQASQRRILWDRIQSYDDDWGRRIGSTCAEAFELDMTSNTDPASILALNDCPFHRFWHFVLGSGRINNIYAISVRRARPDAEWSIDRDRMGVDELGSAFSTLWFGPHPLTRTAWSDRNVESHFEGANLLLTGGAVSNGVTRTYFNHLPGIRYVIDYDAPGFTNIRIHDKCGNRTIVSEYHKDRTGFRHPSIDRGILTIMRSPFASGHFLIGCMGIHGFASLACIRCIYDRHLLQQVMNVCKIPFDDPVRGYQIIAQIDVASETVSLLPDSLHIIRDTPL